ncbi:hypothetical protein [Salinicoccus roseus]|uniref:hypothetical protein n=1 Tax=Salinicoccus roseus TaxID=45670 RepID=UPI001EF58476|nr:hypothetical protein [Salinicoccus roseus]MCG7332274.1 hypothetical protein [Salinicoccus roseus]
MVRLILKTELRSLFNYWKSLGETKMVLYIILGLLLLLFPLPMLVSVVFSLTLSVEESMLDGYMLLLSITAAIILLLLSVHFIIKDLILDRNVQLYLSFPISSAALFFAKFIKHGLIYTASILMPLGVVIGTALSIRFGQWLLLADSLVYFLVLSTVITASAYAFIFLTANILPVRKVSEILSFLGGISFILVYLVLLQVGGSLGGVLSFLADLPITFSGFLYGYEVLPGTIAAVLLIAAAVLAFKAAELVSVRALSRGWETGGRAVRKHRAADGRVRHPIGSLMVKDLRLTTRNFKEIAALLPYYLMPLLFIYFSTSVDAGSAPEAIGASQLLVTAIGGTLVISLFIGAYNTARDAEHFAMLKALPLSGKHIAGAKYGFTLLTTAPVVMAAFTVAWLFSSAGIGVLLQLLVFIILMAMAAVPVGMYTGSANPVVSSKNPVKRLDTASNIVITIVIFVVLVLTAIILGVIGDDGVSAIQLLTAGSILLVMALSSLWMLRKVGARYDQGFKITYKD